MVVCVVVVVLVGVTTDTGTVAKTLELSWVELSVTSVSVTLVTVLEVLLSDVC